jgi:hypothetical protein
MYAVENGGDGTRIDLAAYKTGIGSGVAGAKIVELSVSNFRHLPAAPAVERRVSFIDTKSSSALTRSFDAVGKCPPRDSPFPR